MTDRTNRERQAQFRARRLAAGLVKFTDYVPADKVSELHRLAAQLRAEQEEPYANR
jgi:hypothetical protein